MIAIKSPDVSGVFGWLVRLEEKMTDSRGWILGACVRIVLDSNEFRPRRTWISICG